MNATTKMVFLVISLRAVCGHARTSADAVKCEYQIAKDVLSPYDARNPSPFRALQLD